MVFGIGWLGASRLFGRKPAERPIWGMGAGYVNSANLGIPIAQQVLGNVSFPAEVILFQLLVVMTVLTTLDRHGDATGPIRFRRIASLPVRNPVILGSVLGTIWSAAGLSVPSAVGDSLRLLGAAAVPVALIALIALGASLYSDTPMKAAHAEIFRDHGGETCRAPVDRLRARRAAAPLARAAADGGRMRGSADSAEHVHLRAGVRHRPGTSQSRGGSDNDAASRHPGSGCIATRSRLALKDQRAAAASVEADNSSVASSRRSASHSCCSAGVRGKVSTARPAAAPRLAVAGRTASLIVA